jgi:hypothetical protein
MTGCHWRASDCPSGGPSDLNRPARCFQRLTRANLPIPKRKTQLPTGLRSAVRRRPTHCYNQPSSTMMTRPQRQPTAMTVDLAGFDSGAACNEAGDTRIGDARHDRPPSVESGRRQTPPSWPLALGLCEIKSELMIKEAPKKHGHFSRVFAINVRRGSRARLFRVTTALRRRLQPVDYAGPLPPGNAISVNAAIFR